MARKPFTLNLVLVLFALGGVALAAEAPVAVSPGEASELALVEGRCPTFSWGAVAGANSYELVAYRLGKQGEEASEALRQRFLGAVTSWTPSLGRCLERGGQYAWSVRAEGSKGTSEWSAPSLFEVAAGPSKAELDAAVAAVREVLGQPTEGESVAPAGSGSVVVPATPVPVPPTVPPELTVDGPILATEFQLPAGPVRVATDADLSAHAADPNAHSPVFTANQAAAGVEPTDLSEQTISNLSCTEGEVPTFLSGSWACAFPIVLVSSEIVPDTAVVVRCPAGTELVSGGIGGPNCNMASQTSMCEASSSPELDCFLVHYVSTAAPSDGLTGTATCEVSTVGTPSVPWARACGCFAVCR